MKHCNCHSSLGDGPSDAPANRFFDIYGNPVAVPQYDQEGGGAGYDAVQQFLRENRIVTNNMTGQNLVIPTAPDSAPSGIYSATDQGDVVERADGSFVYVAPAPAPAPAISTDRMTTTIRSPITGAITAEGDRYAAGNTAPVGPAAPAPAPAPATAPPTSSPYPSIVYPSFSFEARPGQPQQTIYPGWVAEQTGDGPSGPGAAPQSSGVSAGVLALLALALLS
jgi:hypothetical protein